MDSRAIPGENDMSVINQMLRDLDARHASQQERAGLPPQLRTLPPLPVTRAKQWRLLVGGMAAGALISAVLVTLFMDAGPSAPSARSEERRVGK